MSSLLNRIWAFIRRDFYITTSYKFNLLFQLTSGFFVLALFYFISHLMDTPETRSLISRFKTDYFSFTLIGVAAAGFLQTGLAGFAERLRTGMTEGALEMMFSCPTKPIYILILPCLWGFLFEALKALIVVLFGIFIFGANLDHANVFGGLVILLLTVASYSVFGLLSASIIMVVKKGDPINMAFSAASSLIAGAYFPVAVLPPWLAGIAKILPMTYAYRGLRLTLLTGVSLSETANEALVLAGFSLIGMPIAILAAQAAINKAKKDGSLGTF